MGWIITFLMQCSYEHKDISEGSEILKRRIYINVKTIKNIGAGCFGVFYYLRMGRHPKY